MNFRKMMSEKYKTVKDLAKEHLKYVDEQIIKKELKQADMNIERVLREQKLKEWLRSGKL